MVTVALLDEIGQVQSLAHVAAGNIDDQAQVGLNHAFPSFSVSLEDSAGQKFFLSRCQQGSFIDLAQVGLQGALDDQLPRSKQ